MLLTRFRPVAVVSALLTAACVGMVEPDLTTLAAVTPAPGASGVGTSGPVTLTFSLPMMSGMERYVDLHQGGVGGPVVPTACAWNPDRTVLTCVPADPLAPGTRYTVHVGGGMRDGQGRMAAMEQWALMGGQWATDGMMGGTHAGQSTAIMGQGWRHGPNHYGMLFPFTTA